MAKHIGVTGTQRGMNSIQKEVFTKLIKGIKEKCPTEEYTLHQGDCIGSDEEATDYCTELGFQIHTHPPTISTKRAFKKSDIIEPEKTYLERNKDIVDSSELLIATPEKSFEEIRSGTWATIRYARKTNKKIIIIFPSGEIKLEGGNSRKED